MQSYNIPDYQKKSIFAAIFPNQRKYYATLALQNDETIVFSGVFVFVLGGTTVGTGKN